MTTHSASTPTDRRTDLITVLLGIWLMGGLFLDGYAHTNFIDELESFITPWHAVFYSGFLATASWIVWTVVKRARGGRGLMAAIPPGYGLAIIGIVVFAAGGIGDAIWHTILGIEEGIDALLSPTHLLLFLGIILIMTTPIRAATIRGEGDTLSGLDRLSVSIAVTLTTALLAFFFVYIWAPGHEWWAQQPFDPATGEGDLMVALGMAGILVSNLILLAPVAVILGRWRPPLGLVTLSWGVVNALTAAAFDLDLALAVWVGLAGGLAADVLTWVTGAGPANRRGTLVVLVIAPLVAWSVYFAGIGLTGQLQWPPEVWGGAILFSALSGLGLTTLSRPVELLIEEPALVESP